MGCDLGAIGAPAPPPPLHITSIHAATSVSDGRLAYEALSPDGTSKVVPTTAIRIRFDRFVLPSSVTRQAVCIQPLLRDVISPAQCALPAFMEPTYDPVLREATYRLPPGASLEVGARYRLTPYLDLPAYELGFRAFDGPGLITAEPIDFTVRDDLAGSPEDALPSLGFCDVPKDTPCEGACSAKEVLANGCASVGCHALAGSEQPAMGLRLDDPSWIAATAIGRAARQTQTGEHAGVPDQTPFRFGRSMPIIEQGGPGNSYLLYKLVVNEMNAIEGAATPDEIARLRDAIVVGAPMPATYGGSGGALPHLGPGQASVLSAWITGGARLDGCP